MSRAGIRLPLLPFIAAALQFGAGLGWRHGMVLVSHALVAVWLLVNAVAQAGWRRAGVVLALAGWSLNLAVMLPNGGMPVSPAAEARLGVGAAAAVAGRSVDVRAGHRSKHVPMDGRTVLAPLGDRYVLSQLGVIYSAGDVLLLAGLLVVLGSVALERPSPSGVAALRVNAG